MTARSLPLFLALLAIDAVSAKDVEQVQSFVQQYCLECHGETVQSAGRRFDHLSLSEPDDKSLTLLADALHALNRGQMPPKMNGVPRPTAAETQSVIEWITQTLETSENSRRPASTVMRRLSRFEYVNTIRDLLGVHTEAFDPTSDFPQDTIEEGFDNIGEAQVLSDYQLQRYLNVADAFLDKAIFFSTSEPEQQSYRFGPRDMADFDSYDRARVVWKLNVDDRYMEIGHGQPVERHTTYPKRFSRKGVPADGYYTIRVRADAINRLDHPYDRQMMPIDHSQPLKMGLWIAPEPRFLLKGAHKGRQLVKVFDLADEQPRDYEAKVWLSKGSTPFVHWINGIKSKGVIKRIGERYHPEVMRLNQYLLDAAKDGDSTAADTAKLLARNQGNKYLSDVYDGPRIRIYSMEIEGPTYDSWPPASHRTLFGKETNPQGIDIAETVKRFASRAFRRQLSAEEVDHYKRFVESRIREGEPRGQAIKLGLAAILTSPRFLYFDEGDGTTLGPNALASRLSYALWGSMPDEELFKLAQSGKLTDPHVLKGQAERLLSDARSAAFVERFTDSWLRLDTLGAMPPDQKKFPQYYNFRLESAMKQETRLFFGHLLENDLSILDFLDSDYTFVNDSLATHYGISRVSGEGFRRVTLPAKLRRGGLLGHASILTLTANGVETSPVTRGVWVLENLLGTPPAPPPPDVEPLEPDTRGTVTIRQQLEKHRSVTACASCHSKIDPFGFPLELYDPIGSFRTSYGERKIKHPIDASSVLPSGQAVSDERDLKHALIANKRQFTRALTEKLLTYATGRMMTFRDQQEIDRITEQIGSDGYGLRTLVSAVLTSETFQRK